MRTGEMKIQLLKLKMTFLVPGPKRVRLWGRKFGVAEHNVTSRWCLMENVSPESPFLLLNLWYH